MLEGLPNSKIFEKLALEEEQKTRIRERLAEFEQAWKSLPRSLKEKIFESSDAGDFFALLLDAKPSAWIGWIGGIKKWSGKYKNPFREIIVRSPLLSEQLRLIPTLDLNPFTKKYKEMGSFFIYNPEKLGRVIETNKDIFERLGYNVFDREDLIKKATDLRNNDDVAFGLLMGYPRPDVLVYAMADEAGRKRMEPILTEEEKRILQGMAKKRLTEETELSKLSEEERMLLGEKLKEKTRISGYDESARPEGYPGRYGVDVKGVRWAEFYESALGEMRKEEIKKAYQEFGFDEILARMRQEVGRDKVK